jgi:hypothetical protein
MMHQAIFEMDAPLCVNGALMLDGLLAWVLAREVGLPQRLSIPQRIDFDLPVARDDRGWFKCSRLLWDGGALDMQTWKKTPRFAKHDRFLSEDKVMVTKGKYKAHQVPIETVAVDRAWFLFESDAPDEVDRMLRRVPGLGKKVSQGHGLWRKLTVQPVAGDFYAEILRPLPMESFSVEDYEDVRVEMSAWYYPYWEPTNRALCATAGRRKQCA